MESRLILHEILCELLGNRNVYYQPPESVKLNYPAIVYSRADIRNAFAGNKVYTQHKSYQLTLIDEDPDSEFLKKISILPKCRYDRNFKSDNLNHDIFTIYF